MSRSLIAALAALMLLGTTSAQSTSNCTRADIVKAIERNNDLSTILTVISALNATYLLPDQSGNGTLFLPSNAAISAALTALNTSSDALLSTYPGKVISVLAYHSLLNQKKTFNRAGLIKASPIQTDLGAIVAAAGGNANYTVTVRPSPGSKFGRETIVGLAPNNTGLVRGVVKTCGLYIYVIEVLLLPAGTLADIPDATDYLGVLPANITQITPGGLAAAIADGTVTLNGAAANGTGSGSGSGSGAPTAGSAAGAPTASGTPTAGSTSPTAAPTQSASTLSAGATLGMAVLAAGAMLLA